MTYLSNNSFENNNAEKLFPNYVINPIKDQNRYRGGAIYIDCQPDLDKDNIILCNTSLANNNTFINNSADIQGGAIAYRSYGPIDVDNSSLFINNSAGVHSPNISSFASQLNISYSNKTSFVNESDLILGGQDLYTEYLEFKFNENYNGSLLKIPSG